ncbi:YncE family protein [Dyella terrae]|uniref:YncE family protein n=1 Tax=Dyella terrae TaxID=522259 RepID=UPI001EFD4CEA|nr:YncE family protein [Dyella terrae]ULU25001.1 YncE family protein [Dyella terrae]
MHRPLRNVLAIALFAACSSHVFAAPQAAPFQVISQLPLGGAGGWDYLSFDEQHRHLFVTRGDRVEVVDVDQNKRVGTIPGTQGVHGVALDPSTHRGYTSNGQSASVTVFDLNTLAVLATIKGTGEKPDAITYDAMSKHVFTFNGKGKSFSVIDPANNTVITTVPLSGKPEFAATDEAGHIYVNNEDTAELIKIDTATNKVVGTWKLGTCESPSGLAIDRKHHRLFSVCDNKQMVVSDADAGKVVASVAIGEGPDAVVFDDATGTVYSSNGESGNITAVHQDDADHYSVAATIPTQPSARTLALDPKLHRLYLSAATLAGPAQEGHHPAIKPDSFTVLTVGAP